MGYRTKATDWKCAGLTQLGGALKVGGGAFLFVFQSTTANYSTTYAYLGAGIGLGGSIGGISLPTSKGRYSWTNLKCTQAFSAANLNYSIGRLSSVGAAVAVGYSAVYITAWTWGGHLFSSQSVGGFSGGGFGGIVITTAGVWKWMDSGAMQR